MILISELPPTQTRVRVLATDFGLVPLPVRCRIRTEQIFLLCGFCFYIYDYISVPVFGVW